MPDDLEALLRALEEHVHLVADLEAVAARRAGVHRNLAVGLRAATAGRQVQRLLAAGDWGHVMPIVGAPPFWMPSPSRVDELRVVLDDAVAPSPPRRTSRTCSDERIGDPVAVAVTAEDGAAAARRGRAPTVGREKVWNDGVERVGEDVGAGDEGDAEEHRERREREPQLAGEQPADRRPAHVLPSWPSPSPRYDTGCIVDMRS